MRALACLSIVWLFASGAAAQDARDLEARDVFDRGTALFNAGEFGEAARMYERAYDLSSRAMILLNASTAWERALQPGQAAEALERYLDVAEAPEDEAALRERLARLRQLADRLDPPPPVTPASPPEQPRDEVPSRPATPPAPASRPAALVSWTSMPPAPPPQVVSSGPNAWGVLGAVTGGASLLSLAIGAVTGAIAISSGSAEDLCPMPICSADQARSLERARSTAHTSTATGLISLGLGAIAILVSITAAVQDGGAPPRQTLLLGPGGVGAHF